MTRRVFRGDLSLASANVGKKVKCVSFLDIPQDVEQLVLYKVYTIRTVNKQGIRLQGMKNDSSNDFFTAAEFVYPFHCFVLADRP